MNNLTLASVLRAVFQQPEPSVLWAIPTALFCEQPSNCLYSMSMNNFPTASILWTTFQLPLRQGRKVFGGSDQSQQQPTNLFMFQSQQQPTNLFMCQLQQQLTNLFMFQSQQHAVTSWMWTDTALTDHNTAVTDYHNKHVFIMALALCILWTIVFPQNLHYEQLAFWQPCHEIYDLHGGQWRPPRAPL